MFNHPVRVRRISGSRGFTIVEMLVVVAIIGLISGVGLLSVRLPLARSRFANEVEQIVAIDSQARILSAKGEPVVVRIDANLDKISIQSTTGSRSVTLSGRDPLSGILTDGFVESNQKVVEIVYGLRGTSPSYALRLHLSDERSKWLVVMGMTGESYLLDEREWSHAQISAIFAQRSDAS